MQIEGYNQLLDNKIVFMIRTIAIKKMRFEKKRRTEITRSESYQRSDRRGEGNRLKVATHSPHEEHEYSNIKQFFIYLLWYFHLDEFSKFSSSG